jgi:hypothetical protein
VSSRWAATLFAALLAASSTGSARADFYDGLEAHSRGDYATAYAEWLPLAEAGDSSAQGNLGVLYWKGQGVEANAVEAVRWFYRAAERGNPEAQNNLGQMYYLGEGVPRDLEAAARWIKASAVQGDPSAQLRLGILYAEGIGLDRDPPRALFWWRKSAAQGNAAAEAKVAEAEGADAASWRLAARTPALEESVSTPEAAEIADVPTLPQVQDVASPAAPESASPGPAAPAADPIPVSPTPGVASGPPGGGGPAAAAVMSSGFLVQIASVSAVEHVEPEWSRLQRRHQDLLGDLELDVEKGKLGARVVYRLRVGPPRDRAAAEVLCEALAERRIGCLLREAP